MARTTLSSVVQLLKRPLTGAAATPAAGGGMASLLLRTLDAAPLFDVLRSPVRAATDPDTDPAVVEREFEFYDGIDRLTLNADRAPVRFKRLARGYVREAFGTLDHGEALFHREVDVAITEHGALARIELHEHPNPSTRLQITVLIEGDEHLPELYDLPESLPRHATGAPLVGQPAADKVALLRTRLEAVIAEAQQLAPAPAPAPTSDARPRRGLGR